MLTMMPPAAGRLDILRSLPFAGLSWGGAPPAVPDDVAFSIGALVIYLAIAILGLIGSSGFSGIETGCYTMSRLRLLLRAGTGDPQAAILRRETGDMQRLLSTLLIGNNAANYAASFGLTAILSEIVRVSDWSAILIQALGLTPLLFIFGETLPKEICRAHADVIVYRAARLLRWTRLFFTVIGLLPIVNRIGRLLTRVFQSGDPSPLLSARSRMSAFLHEGVGHGVLSQHQIDLVDRALASGSLRIREIMTPWRAVRTLRYDMTRPDLRAMRDRLFHSRYPVIDGAGRVVGVLPLMEALVETRPIRIGRLARPVVTLEPETNIREALDLMRRNRALVAVVGSAERPLGIISRKDILDPLLGTLAAA